MPGPERMTISGGTPMGLNHRSDEGRDPRLVTVVGGTSPDAAILTSQALAAAARSAPATRVPSTSEALVLSSEQDTDGPHPGRKDTPTFCEEYGLLIFAILAYSCVSLAVVYYNWWLFTSGFKFPVFVSWIQQVVGTCIFFLGSQVALYFSSLRPIFPHPDFKPGTAWKIIPLSISFVLTVGLANICLQKTLISTYQVARSLTLLFVIILSYMLLKEKQTALVLVACGMMVVGFIIGSLDPETLSLGGLIAGGLSSFFQSLYNVLIAKTMPAVHGDNQLLLFYNVALSSFFFIPMTLIAEDLSVWPTAFGRVEGTSMFVVWGGMALSGLLGTMLNMTQYLVVKVTSPLTFNIVGFSKSLVQSLGGIVFFGDKVSFESATGLVLCLFGSGLYAKAKNDVQKKKKAAAAQEKAEQAELLKAKGSPLPSTPATGLRA
eukprot:Blabericola_migrator_1__973@NODE_1243_length_5009_cov_73_028329_g840_i0_p1_GENE_NODE_1243_length_5009_cov_73_028329_g840_i0NODE_1243_length_5009_cov_73_028329_g840_i0_p1_ORF_typecomplete_len434_score43_85TPT/PF03151_16/1_2e58UAA/PF08449_11/6_8e16EamA/PF00892_20/0_00014EamA/PF00892_20/1e07PUNUT/PF16913_5/4_1e10Nuc_sug_transp/PF04142_15/1_6e02Nuc_sug_transp/PF04142_15/1_6e08Nuc_sug_transp/PF04142_15/0_066SLC35F/PF06027_12/2_1e03SLC35F/PF06027_12/2_3e08CRTlike/PF08627_10/2_4e05CRTlike/PF08627_10/6e